VTKENVFITMPFYLLCYKKNFSTTVAENKLVCLSHGSFLKPVLVFVGRTYADNISNKEKKYDKKCLAVFYAIKLLLLTTEGHKIS
jgi:hypothetical protein